MQQTKTTPQWIIELRQKLREDSKTSSPKSPTKINKVKKVKRRRKSKPDDHPENLQIPASRVAIHYAAKNRETPTKGESAMNAILQESLSSREIAFARQVPIDQFIVDFLVLKKRLVIEVDGEYHFFRGKEDYLRTKDLRRLGYNVIRFTNHDVLSDAPRVRNEILERCVGSHAVLHLD